MPEQLSRRARYRRQTTDEAKQIALRQLAASGPQGISLNAIAKEMGLTGPALYRYFASRDELLRTLVADAWDDLATTLQHAAEQAGGRPPADRLRAVAGAYRRWAQANAPRYRLVLATPIGTGVRAPERMVAALHRTVRPFLGALAAPGQADEPEHAGPASAAGPGSALWAQLEHWAHTPDGAAVPPAVAHQALAAWTRLHGLVSLELLDHFTHQGLDADLLYDAEIEAIVATAIRQG